MHGTPCFTGTRVPVQTLLDYIEEGDTLDSFLKDFSTVTKEQAIQFLKLLGFTSLTPAKRLYFKSMSGMLWKAILGGAASRTW